MVVSRIVVDGWHRSVGGCGFLTWGGTAGGEEHAEQQ
jgi:hypothetical protein